MSKRDYEVKGRAESNTTTINCGYVGPNLPSSVQLGPGTYSLSKRSNVPFVALVGPMGNRKVISWGETVVVPCNQLATVNNASFHGGDIWINKGDDVANRPSRISVPVRFTTTEIQYGEETRVLWYPVFPCDTRACHRAYLSVDAYVDPAIGQDGLTAFIRGRRLDGSMETANSLASLSAPFGPAVGFLSAVNYGVNTVLSYVPLGQGSNAADDTRPHNLLDAGDIFFLFNNGATVADSLNWPADRGVFGFPSGQTDAPGCWYIIEYE